MAETKTLATPKPDITVYSYESNLIHAKFWGGHYAVHGFILDNSDFPIELDERVPTFTSTSTQYPMVAIAFCPISTNLRLPLGQFVILMPFFRTEHYGLYVFVGNVKTSNFSYNIEPFFSTNDEKWYQTAQAYLPSFYAPSVSTVSNDFTLIFGSHLNGDTTRLTGTTSTDIAVLWDDMAFAYLALWIHAQGTTMSISEIKALAIFQGERGTYIFDRASRYIQDNPDIVDPLVVW